MRKPYEVQLLSVKRLDELASWPTQMVVAVAILFWMKEEVKLALKDELENVEVELAWARYHGAGYPALALRYLNRVNPKDIGFLVEATMDEILDGKHLTEFMEYAAKSGIDWSKKLEDLRGDED